MKKKKLTKEENVLVGVLTTITIILIYLIKWICKFIILIFKLPVILIKSIFFKNKTNTTKMANNFIDNSDLEAEEENNIEEDNIDEKLEREMELYGLKEWQKELVRKGEYDPWNFEEDGDLEEDDYYYEDKE